MSQLDKPMRKQALGEVPGISDGLLWLLLFSYYLSSVPNVFLLVFLMPLLGIERRDTKTHDCQLLSTFDGLLENVRLPSSHFRVSTQEFHETAGRAGQTDLLIIRPRRNNDKHEKLFDGFGRTQ